jgi:hypothetical protein
LSLTAIIEKKFVDNDNKNVKILNEINKRHNFDRNKLLWEYKLVKPVKFTD